MAPCNQRSPKTRALKTRIQEWGSDMCGGHRMACGETIAEMAGTRQ